jgi:very-short-patch-repair endonuclease
LRKGQTEAERKLWNQLGAKRMEKFKFRRQQPVGPYIVDFICFEKQLIIELDGSQHMQQMEKDVERDKWFEEQGYTVLRLWDNEIFENLNGVLDSIRQNLV